MLSEEQKDQYVAFVANLTNLIREETNMTREQASCVVNMAASTLLGAVFHVEPDRDEAMDAFVMRVIRVAIRREYAVKLHD